MSNQDHRGTIYSYQPSYQSRVRTVTRVLWVAAGGIAIYFICQVILSIANVIDLINA